MIFKTENRLDWLLQSNIIKGWMNMKPLGYLLSLAVLLTGCASMQPEGETIQQTEAERLIHRVETAHGVEVLDRSKAIHAKVHVVFPGAFELKGDMAFVLATGQARLDLADGKSVVFDGQAAYVTGGQAGPMDRFHVLTWPYFLSSPFRMTDGGVVLGVVESLPLRGLSNKLQAVNIGFEAGTGDAPDDWYKLFVGPGDRISALAYIVTFGKTVEQAEASPSIMVVSKHTKVDGLLLPTSVTFAFWDENSGITKEKGTATFSDVRIQDPTDDLFKAPANAAIAPLPGG